MNSRRPSSPRRKTSTRPAARPRTTRSTKSQVANDPRLKRGTTKRAIVIGSTKPRSLSLRLLSILFFIVLAVVIITPTLGKYLDQQQEIRQLRATIEETKARNDALEAEVELWNDPEYVKAQARQRLGYVMPGQTLYTVTDPNAGTAQEQRQELEAEIEYNRRAATPWFVSLWDSVTVSGYVQGDTLDVVEPDTGHTIDQPTEEPN